MTNLRLPPIEYRDWLSRLLTQRTGDLMSNVVLPNSVQASDAAIYGGLTILRNNIDAADIVLWRGDLLAAACRNMELFALEPPQAEWMPARPQLWMIDRSTADPDAWRKLAARSHMRPSSMLVWANPPVITVTNRWRESIGIAVFMDLPGEPLPTIVALDPVELGSATIAPEPALLMAAAGLSFLGQPFVTTRKEHVGGRPRRFRHVSKLLHQSEIQRVILRQKSMVDPRNPAAEKEHRESEYAWIVGGHWRRLHAPRKSDGAQITYVRAYVKGDPDKPMLPPKQRVSHVKR